MAVAGVEVLARYRGGGWGGRGNGSWLVVICLLGAVLALIAWRKVSQRLSRAREGAAPESHPQDGVVPDWYPDPQDSTVLRYYDGRAWTSHIRPRDG